MFVTQPDIMAEDTGELVIDGSRILDANMAADTRFVFNEGGVRSTKTYSLCKLFIILALEGAAATFTICRLKSTWLRDTAMKDFFDILTDLQIYDPDCHNKTERIYRLNGSEFQFIGLDEEQKLRGRKQDYLWINEANEADYDSIRQLLLRTEIRIFFDYNPSLTIGHWLDEKFLDSHTRKAQCTIIRSTYRDNPFLSQEIINEIEALEHEDPIAWAIYGLGLRAKSPALILQFDVVPDSDFGEADHYGLDFGFNHPAVLTGIRTKEHEAWLDEVVFKSFLTTLQLGQLMEACGVSKDKNIYADNARPEAIEELCNMGFRVLPCNKTSVKEGLDTVKSYKLHYTERSTKSIKQCRNYKYKQSKGQILEDPVKFEDDAPDSIRYGLHTAATRGDIPPARIHIIRRKR